MSEQNIWPKVSESLITTIARRYTAEAVEMLAVAEPGSQLEYDAVFATMIRAIKEAHDRLIDRCDSMQALVKEALNTTNGARYVEAATESVRNEGRR
jgi:hypothetical protein